MKKTYFLTLVIVAVFGLARVDAFATAEAPTNDSSDASSIVAPQDSSSDASTQPEAPADDSSDASNTQVTTPTDDSSDASGSQNETAGPIDDSGDASGSQNETAGPTDDSSDASGEQSTVPTTPAPTPTTTPTPIDASKLGPIGGGGSGSSGGSSSGGTGITVGTPISATATSTVIGIDPNCSKLFKTYMGLGKKNNKAEVMRLQAFLNEHINAKLVVDGSFGSKTKTAVKAFQTKYASTILLPWDVAKLSTNLVSNPTGYVYKTTQYQLNLLVCPAFSAPAPKLP